MARCDHSLHASYCVTGPLARDEIVARLALILAPGVGSQNLRSLLREFHSGEAVLRLARSSEIGSIEPEVTQALTDSSLAYAERALRLGEASNWVAVTPEDLAWPTQLENLDRPPALIWTRGEVSFLTAPSVAIVGSASTGHPQLRAELDVGTALMISGWVVAPCTGGVADALLSRAAGRLSAPLLTVVADPPRSLEIFEAEVQVSEMPFWVGGSRQPGRRAEELAIALTTRTLIVGAESADTRRAERLARRLRRDFETARYK